MLITKLLQAHSKLALETTFLTREIIIFAQNDDEVLTIFLQCEHSQNIAVYFRQVVKHDDSHKIQMD